MGTGRSTLQLSISTAPYSASFLLGNEEPVLTLKVMLIAENVTKAKVRLSLWGCAEHNAEMRFAEFTLSGLPGQPQEQKGIIKRGLAEFVIDKNAKSKAILIVLWMFYVITTDNIWTCTCKWWLFGAVDKITSVIMILVLLVKYKIFSTNVTMYSLHTVWRRCRCDTVDPFSANICHVLSHRS